MTNAVTIAQGGSTGVIAGFKNRLINGNMSINQRGVTSGLVGGYFVDRWQIGGLSTSGLSPSVPTGFTQGISLTRPSAGSVWLYQNIESTNCADLYGKQVTVSFWAYNATGINSISVSLNVPTLQNNFASVTTMATNTVTSSPAAAWTYYSTTFTVSSTSVALGLQVYIFGTALGAATMYITGVQLEVGTVATSFDWRPYGIELLMCQRYYFQGSSPSTYYRASTNSTAATPVAVSFPTEMRVSPTLTVTAFANNDIAANGGATVVNKIGVIFRLYSTTGGYDYAYGVWTFNVSAEL